ncbi:MAG: benzoyl-CoA reductase subunit D [Deltaproteobacteria bacterium]|nr:benzoyl-CoA reductase subunit D [Deltaproteobacteria bacterium]
MIVTAGVDVGASAIKVALMESPENGGRERVGARVLAKSTERIRRRDPKEVVDLALRRAFELAGVEESTIQYLATTGEGELVERRVGHFYGMTTHARGASFLDPAVRSVIDVGALHGRAIKMDERSKVLGYRMTSQCASGSGQFLENIARYLGVSLHEIGPLSRSAAKGEKISGICAVLAETDVINMVSRSIPVPSILRGIHDSMASRLVKLLRSLEVQGTVMVTGGLSADVGLVGAMQDCLEENGVKEATIGTHPDAVYAGAFGAALWGAYRFEKLNARAAA